MCVEEYLLMYVPIWWKNLSNMYLHSICFWWYWL